MRRLATITYLVRDYDEAVSWFCKNLSFKLVEDIPVGDGKRWVVVSPGDDQYRLLLAKADGVDQKAHIGKQAGGRVAFFLETDDFDRDYSAMRAKGVMFLEQPRHEPYGVVVVFEDLYGNKWDLIEPMRQQRGLEQVT